MIRHRNQGFSLIELLFTIVLLGSFLATVVVSMRKQKRIKLNEVVYKINDFFQKALTSTLLTKQKHKVVFKIEKGKLRKIYYKKDKENSENQEKKDKNEENHLLETEPVSINKLFINGKNQLQSNTDEAWFFINPEGYSQEVDMNISVENKINEQVYFSEMDLYMNPIFCQLHEKEAE